jgi:hypothetical protein
MCRSPHKTSIIPDAMRTGRDWPVMSSQIGKVPPSTPSFRCHRPLDQIVLRIRHVHSALIADWFQGFSGFDLWLYQRNPPTRRAKPTTVPSPQPMPSRVVDPNRKQAVIAIVAAILTTRKLATVPQNSPAYVAAIADAVADAQRIVDRVENRLLRMTGADRCFAESGCGCA